MPKRKKIMLIDDDEQQLAITRELLEYEGYDVLTHRLGFGASSAVRANQPDLVLLDINMPALSGEKLSEIIRANVHTKHVPIVFFSSNDEVSLASSVTKYAVRGYICKGNIADLRRKVAAYLQEPHTA